MADAWHEDLQEQARRQDASRTMPDDRINRTAQRLANSIMAERQHETVAHKSPAVMRLWRLGHRISDLWLFPAPAHGMSEREQLAGICVELLALFDHLGLADKAVAQQCLRDVEEQIADEVEAEQRLGSNLLHILDELDTDSACHQRMRASIDKLMDRVQFWREHPGEAYEGQGVADALMPIITQLLEHRQQEVGR